MRGLNIPGCYKTSPPSIADKCLLAIIFSTFAIITFYTMLHHELWRDETYVWLVARDLNLIELIEELGYNAAPGLWHFILMFPAKLGLPVFSQQLIHWLIACAAVCLLLFRSPFNLAVKVLFAFSALMLYHYAIVVRGYGLTILLMFAACILFPQRLQRPVLYCLILGLLSNSTVYGLISATVFGTEYLVLLFKTKKPAKNQIIALAGLFVAGCFALYCVYPPADAVPYFVKHFAYDRTNDFLKIFGIGIYGQENFARSYNGQLFSLIFIIFTLYIFIRNKAYFALSMLLTGWIILSYFMLYKYQHPSIRHFGFYLIFLMISLWLAYYKFKTPAMADKAYFFLLALFLAMHSYTSIQNMNKELNKTPISGGKDMAKYLQTWPYDEYLIVGDYNSFMPSVIIHMPTDFKMWYPAGNQFGSFVHFTAESRYMFHINDIYKYGLIKSGHDLAKVFFLLSYKVPPSCSNMELIHESKGLMESFYLYKAQSSSPNC